MVDKVAEQIPQAPKGRNPNGLMARFGPKAKPPVINLPPRFPNQKGLLDPDRDFSEPTPTVQMPAIPKDTSDQPTQELFGGIVAGVNPNKPNNKQ